MTRSAVGAGRPAQTAQLRSAGRPPATHSPMAISSEPVASDMTGSGRPGAWRDGWANLVP
jgi:hypothetical protein